MTPVPKGTRPLVHFLFFPTLRLGFPLHHLPPLPTFHSKLRGGEGTRCMGAGTPAPLRKRPLPWQPHTPAAAIPLLPRGSLVGRTESAETSLQKRKVKLKKKKKFKLSNASRESRRGGRRRLGSLAWLLLRSKAERAHCGVCHCAPEACGQATTEAECGPGCVSKGG